MATIDIKAQEPGLLAFCATHDLPLRVIAREQIAQRACHGQAGKRWRIGSRLRVGEAPGRAPGAMLEAQAVGMAE